MLKLSRLHNLALARPLMVAGLPYNLFGIVGLSYMILALFSGYIIITTIIFIPIYLYCYHKSNIDPEWVAVLIMKEKLKNKVSSKKNIKRNKLTTHYTT